MNPCLQSRQSDGAKQAFDTNSRLGRIGNNLSRTILALCGSISPSVDAVQITRELYFVRVIQEYHLQRTPYWFMAPSTAIRNSLVAQLKNSKKIKWIVYLAAKLFQALNQSTQTSGSTTQRYIGWIDKLDRKLAIDPHSRPSLSDMAGCLRVQLEASSLSITNSVTEELRTQRLAFLKFTVVDSVSGYNLLQKAVPSLLHLVATGTNLCMERPNGSLVTSFPRTLCAPRFELRRFVMYDMVVSLVLGAPQLVEYGYDDEYGSSSYGFEWVHGIPSALVETISWINSWRARSGVCPIDWQALERHVLAWQPPSVESDGEGTAAGSVARLTVQEGWRHVVLIYIYMGICGVSSHDSRVQASVHQIAQLGGTVANLPISVHMFPHYVIAGLAARLEKRRVLVYEMLLSFNSTRVWLFRGPEFGQALYYSWHGVGVGGAPVTWDHYVQSRLAVIPI